jgi:hypothetical protein
VNERLIDAETTVRSPARELTRLTDEEPKSKDWQKRSKAGDEKKWRRDVEEHTAKGDEGLEMGFLCKIW